MFGKRHLDIGVGRSHGTGVRIRGVDSGVREADVIDDRDQFFLRNHLADGVVDPVALRGHVFNARAGARPHVQHELAAVHAGKEIFAKKRIEKCSRPHTQHEEEDDEERGVSDAQLQHAPVAAADLLKAGLEGELEDDEGITAPPLAFAYLRVMLAQQILRHGGDDRARKQVRRQHCKDDSFSQRHKEVLRHAAEEEHRHEDDADGEGGDKGRPRDLCRAVENRLLDGLTLFQVAIDVLNLDRSVVDQDAHGQRQAAERHDVDRFAQRAQHQQRSQNRQRDGDGDDEGAAPAAEEDEDHNRRETSGDDGFVDDTVDRVAHEDGLIGQRDDPQLRRQLRFQAVGLAQNPLHDI